MERLRLADGTEMEISEGSDLRNITTGLKSYAELDGLAGKLTRENLTRVQFLTDEMLTGEYRDMELCTQSLRSYRKRESFWQGSACRRSRQRKSSRKRSIWHYLI